MDLPGPRRVLRGWEATSVLALKEDWSASLQMWRWIGMRPAIASHPPIGDILVPGTLLLIEQGWRDKEPVCQRLQ
jgi:hypothetical protein